MPCRVDYGETHAQVLLFHTVLVVEEVGEKNHLILALIHEMQMIRL